MTADDWDLFEDWCAATGHVALPTTWEVVEVFVDEVQAAPSVVVRRLGAIRARSGHDTNTPRRDLAGAPPRRPTPIPWRTPAERSPRRWQFHAAGRGNSPCRARIGADSYGKMAAFSGIPADALATRWWR